MKQFFIFTLLFIVGIDAQANSCNWSAPQKIGEISREVEEISGMAVSQQFPDRFYSHNDSGSSASFFISALNGSNTREVSLNGGSAFDVEDISVGPCGSDKCIFLADIGDNYGIRGGGTINIIKEQENFPRQVDVLKSVSFKYPNGSKNAEAMAVHPNGDLYIVTKEKSGSGAGSAEIYRIKKEELFGKSSPKPTYLGAISVPAMVGDSSKRAVVTGMDISADGQKFALITYKDSIEFYVDLSTITTWNDQLVRGKDYRLIKLLDTPLAQQESISYTGMGNGMIFSTELGDGSDQPIYKLECSGSL